jgi:outer membrane protein assembly factor BamB
MSHGSIMPVTIDGTNQYSYLTLKGAVGVDAATGALLWDFPWQFNTAVATSPLPIGEGRLLLTSGYHAHTVIIQIRRQGKAWVAEEVASLPAPTAGWNSEVHTPILHRGKVYGIGKKSRGLWTCLNLDGEELWTSRGMASFGLGGYLLVDEKFIVLEDRTGIVRMLDASANEYRELASAKLIEGPEVWAPPVVSHGKLLVRGLSKLVCVDISDRSGEEAVALSGEPPSQRARTRGPSHQGGGKQTGSP